MSVIFRILVGGLFIYSGWSKLIRPAEEFQFVIDQYQAFPYFLAKIISHVIPWMELTFGAFLLLGFMRKVSARTLSLLCAGFILLLASAVIRGIDLANCGCFGENIHLTPVQAVTLDSCLFAILTYLSISKKQIFELDSWLNQKRLAK